ncbi:MAG: hypothetical protein RJB13_1987 [Pseudomonadota bacterium]
MSEQQQSPEEKEWSEIRDEIMRKVELFTDRQIERLKASIHKRTAPKPELETESSEHHDLSDEIEKLDLESGQVESIQTPAQRSRIPAHRKHKRKSA